MKKEKAKASAPKKKAEPRKKALKPMAVASGEYCFFVHHGPVVRDLKELHAAFQAMTPEQFAHHVSHDKNDFCAWVMEVLADKKTARMLAKARTREEAGEIIEAALANYIA